MSKQALRDKLKTQRMQLAGQERNSLSAAAQSALVDSSFFRIAGCVALYSPIQGEVDTTHLFLVAQQMQKKVCFPRVVGNRMVFVEVSDLSFLARGGFGLLEPTGRNIVPTADLDLMVVPGLAFDQAGHRLGYGKGFYDRELHSVGFSGVLIGLCYGFQLLDRLPVEEHDVPVAHIVTEQGLFSPLHSTDRGGSP